jgi:hypothetical protein
MGVPKIAASLSLFCSLLLASHGPAQSGYACPNCGYATGYPAYGFGYYHYDGSYHPYAGYGYDATRRPVYSNGYYRPYWRRYGYGWHRLVLTWRRVVSRSLPEVEVSHPTDLDAGSFVPRETGE